MNLAGAIITLLENNECVVVPEFGGFVTNPTSARLDELQHKFHPPGKSVSFNAKLTSNDGLLMHYLSEELDISYEAAGAKLKKEVASIHERLDNDQRYYFKQLGRFKKTEDGRLLFEPDFKHSGGHEMFGLEPFYAIPNMKSAEIQEDKSDQHVIDDHNVVDQLEETVSASSSAKRWKVGAAAAIALPVAGYLTWLAAGSGILTQDQRFHYSDLNPFSEKICTLYQPRTAHAELNEPKNEDSRIVFPELVANGSGIAKIRFLESEPGSVTVRLIANQPSKSISKNIIPGRATKQPFHIVAGCFRIKSNANQLIERLEKQGINASILDVSNGLHRVTAGSYPNKAPAVDALRSFQQRHISSAWLTTIK